MNSDFDLRHYSYVQLVTCQINLSEYISMMDSEIMVLRIKGYLEYLDLDDKTRQIILDLCKGYNRANLTIADEILKELGKTVKQKL